MERIVKAWPGVRYVLCHFHGNQYGLVALNGQPVDDKILAENDTEAIHKSISVVGYFDRLDKYERFSKRRVNKIKFKYFLRSLWLLIRVETTCIVLGTFFVFMVVENILESKTSWIVSILIVGCFGFLFCIERFEDERRECRNEIKIGYYKPPVSWGSKPKTFLEKIFSK